MVAEGEFNPSTPEAEPTHHPEAGLRFMGTVHYHRTILPLAACMTAGAPETAGGNDQIVMPGTDGYRWALQAEAERLTLYGLRHTAASLLLSGGVHIKAVSERLGHSSTAFTMDTYVHSLPTVREEAAAKLEGMLCPSKVASR